MKYTLQTSYTVQFVGIAFSWSLLLIPLTSSQSESMHRSQGNHWH